MRTIVIHLGFPKTATTTLQSAFMKAPSVSYIGKGIRDRSEIPSLSVEVAKATILSDRRRFEESAPLLRKEILSIEPKGNPILMSDEAFTFAEYMQIGNRWKRQTVSDHREMAYRLRCLAPEAKVMFSVRNQFDLIRSFYRQAAKVGRIEESFQSYVQRGSFLSIHDKPFKV